MISMAARQRTLGRVLPPWWSRRRLWQPVNVRSVVSCHPGGLAGGWWKLLHVALAVLYIAAGVVAFIHPGDTFAALAAMFSFILVFAGTFDIVESISVRDESDVWWVQLIGGIIELGLGFWAAGYYVAAPSCSSLGWRLSR
jgi:uncharacterized membrane protein HdeD (DUF308 family)